MAAEGRRLSVVRATPRRPLVATFAALDHYPAMARAQARALAVASDDDAGLDALAAAVERDLGLALAILRAAAAVGGQAGDVVRAVESLGRGEVVRLVEVTPTFDFLHRAPEAVGHPELAIHAAAVQRVARRIAEQAGFPATGEIATAALLHDIGKLALAAAYTAYPEEVYEVARTPEERVAREREVLDVDHAKVGGELARSWGLTRAVATAIERHHDSDAAGAAAVVRLADLLTNFQQGQPVDPVALLAASLALGFGRDDLGDLMYELVHPLELSPRDEVVCPLTTRELEILSELARGKLSKQIAADLGVSVSTVRNHLHNAYRKLDAADRTQAVLIARERGWI
jgi:putative nucleotidyltransferase with HDIG domain